MLGPLSGFFGLRCRLVGAFLRGGDRAARRRGRSGSRRLRGRRWRGASGPVTSGPVTSGPVTSGPVISGPVTSGRWSPGLPRFNTRAHRPGRPSGLGRSARRSLRSGRGPCARGGLRAGPGSSARGDLRARPGPCARGGLRTRHRTLLHRPELGEQDLPFKEPEIRVLEGLCRPERHVDGKAHQRKCNRDHDRRQLRDRVSSARADITIDPEHRGRPQHEEVPADHGGNEAYRRLPVAAWPANQHVQTGTSGLALACA